MFRQFYLFTTPVLVGKHGLTSIHTTSVVTLIVSQDGWTKTGLFRLLDVPLSHRRRIGPPEVTNTLDSDLLIRFVGNESFTARPEALVASIDGQTETVTQEPLANATHADGETPSHKNKEVDNEDYELVSVKDEDFELMDQPIP